LAQALAEHAIAYLVMILRKPDKVLGGDIAGGIAVPSAAIA
jgi:hypothetical protein